MEQTTVSEHTTRLEKLAKDSVAGGYGLNVVLVYEDAVTRKWAREVFERAARVGGQNHVRVTWWKLEDLEAPGVLAGAISTAMRADAVVIATRGLKPLPMSFYLWAETWLAHRVPATGALVALLAKPNGAVGEQARLRQYLDQAARQARLDLMIEECDLPKTNGGKRRQRESAVEPEPESGDTELLTLAFAS